MRYALILTVLGVFWLVLSGHFTPLLITLGAASVLLVLWFVRRMDRVDTEIAMLRPSPGLLGYLAWLLWSVIKANVDLARRIWDPALPVHPVWERLETRVATAVHTTLYANSITLTPGTLTTDVGDGYFMIHAVTPEGLKELEEGEMERRILRLDL
jgi:multicomponent Na+:H+ antiporter subunit E